jgi:hypothetical protein
MERSRILGAGVWTVVGLAAAFAVVGATSSRHCATATKATAAKATVATAASHDCCASDKECANDAKVATVTPAPKAVKPVAKPAAKPLAGNNSTTNGMVIAIDPESGTLGMPSATQMQQLRAQMSLDETSRTGAVETVMPDGSLRLDLNGSFADYATIQIAPNGQKIFGCTTNPHALEQPAPTTLEEK